MSYLPNSKWGNCSVCPAKNTACVKVGKELICIRCRNNQKTVAQIKKANERNAIRAKISPSKTSRQSSSTNSIEGQEDSLELQEMALQGIDESLQNLISDLDTLVSRYIRVKYSDKENIVKCYTCGWQYPIKKMQCGHFIPRSHLQTRWLEENLRPQCENCNCHLHGNLEVFAANLEKERAGIVVWLQEQGRMIYKPTRDDLKRLLIDYQALYREANVWKVNFAAK